MKNQRIFAGIYPEGIVYADRKNDEHGDYKRLAFLPYSTLELEVRKGCPKDLAAEIRADAAQFKVGDVLQLSTAGQTITLGWKAVQS